MNKETDVENWWIIGHKYFPSKNYVFFFLFLWIIQSQKLAKKKHKENVC